MKKTRTVSSQRANTPSKRTPLQWGIQIFGELLITLALLLFLFVAWQLWWTNIDANKTQASAVSSLAQEFAAAASAHPSQASSSTASNTSASADTATLADGKEPPTPSSVTDGKAYGIVYIPRFGESYERPIAEGTSTAVLDTLGLGHYTGTAMPGQIGNFSLAGHRQTNGAVLDRIEEIQKGDHIYVQTIDGYYTYAVYATQIVLPTDVYVIAHNPDNPDAPATERLMTLTTCHPRFGDSHRYIVHAKLENWQPLSAGAPAEIKNSVANN